MNAKRLERFEQLLVAERGRLAKDLARADAGPTPEDDSAVLLHEEATLREVDEALRRLRESPHDYGICEQCGRPIPEERLVLLPATRVCGRGAAADMLIPR